MKEKDSLEKIQDIVGWIFILLIFGLLGLEWYLFEKGEI